jgi:hypothetical protein
VAAIVALLFVAPAGASAVTIQYVKHDVTLQAGVSRVIRAKCPAKTHVVGGGGHQRDASPLSLYSSSTFPYDGPDSNSKPDDGWKVRYTTYDQPEYLTAVAACASVMPHYSSFKYDVPGDVSDEQNVDCGGSRQVLAGGYRGDPSIKPWTSIPHDGGASGDAWQLAMYSSTGIDQPVTGYAICGGLDITYVHNPTDFLAGSGPRFWWNVDSTCPPDHHTAIGGGYLVGAPSLRSYIHVQDNSPIDVSTFNLWRVDVDTSGIQTDPQVEGWAVCAAAG